jgi:putative glycosyltransferase (TIGR04348 family)
VKALIVNPAADASTLGNSITAERWARIIGLLGHDAAIVAEWRGEPCDLLIALHARRSYSSIEAFSSAHRGLPVIVALTGTDVYRDLAVSREARRSLAAATRVVALQAAALDELDDDVRAKSCVIYQSATAPQHCESPSEEFFEVCVLSHLRNVKDPLRPAHAARRLPQASRIRIVHAGRALDRGLADAARREEDENPRYRWIGEQSHDDALQLLARSRLFVLPSMMEGGANAIAEAVVCGVPILCSDISGNVGMLDRTYPGYFRVGDTQQLANMLHRAEADRIFLNRLSECVMQLQSRFEPAQEVASWRRLLELFFP